jgi:hypothetical protein
MAALSPKPNTPSSDYNAMCDYWEAVSAILGGAKTMRAAGEKYLPKFPQEEQTDYDFRRKNAKFTNIFRDITENLAAKPFTEEVTLKNGASDRIKSLAEDIDGKGNHLSVFAQSTFFTGIAYAITWILVDYTKGVPPQATIALEKQLGARPYWVHIPAQRLLAIYSDIVGGVEVFTHARIQEDVVERDGYGETTKKRVRVFDRKPVIGPDGNTADYLPATWQLFEEQSQPGAAEKLWVEIESGVVTIGIIPLVPFTTGRRIGSAWQLAPSMQDCVDLQIELYQQESGLKNIKESTAFPMLSGNGIAPAMGQDGRPLPIRVGPKSVLYAPPREQGAVGSWTFIEPAAQSMKFLADDIKETIQQLRELGRQPLTAQTGNLTVVTTAFAAQKGNSAIQAWALNLKDALERAFAITAKWLGENQEAEVQVDTDFDVGLNDDKDRDTLVAMRAARDISQRTLWSEMQRRAVLSPDFEAEDEEQALLDELPADTNGAVDPITGEPLDPLNLPQPGPKKPIAA